MDIPLYHMIGLQVVRPALTVDIKKLKADFVHGYRPGAAVFYVSTTNFQGLEREVMQEERGSWDRHWQKRDREFEAFLHSDPDLKFLSNKYFYIWDGNHYRQAWTEFIAKSYADDIEWHYRVRAIVIRTKEDPASILTAMHDINRATENSHVKTNLVHALHRMRKVGTLNVDKFRSLLTEDEFQATSKAVKDQNSNKPWYNLPWSRFLEYIYSISLYLT